MTTDVLDTFSPATAAWFRGSFAAPTPAQAGAWTAIGAGRDALVVAPTGSGKTLAAFLWSIDRLLTEAPPADPLQRCRVLYVSPLKALAVDVERNLRAPLVGIGHAAARLGLAQPEINVSVRSGDTAAAERRGFAKRPSDILITTPESLFLLLTSAARAALTGVETVILDEVHAIAGTKRGAHLAVSLARLDALLPRPARRVGLSATVRPLEEVARFLGGGRPVEIVAPPAAKEWDLEVVVPIPDMSGLGEISGDLTGAAAAPERRASIWPHVEERIVDLAAQQRSTLIFANSRRLAERLTARLNEIWDERQLQVASADTLVDAKALVDSETLVDGKALVNGEALVDGESVVDAEAMVGGAGPATSPVLPARTPAQVMAQAGGSAGAPAVFARAHHGSVSKEARAEIEEALKAGRLPAVVATSSLELGIDMGAVDLVIQVESPPSVASGLQRVGRAGHQVGARSRGVFFPKYRGDLVQTAVVVQRMAAGGIEALRVPAAPLDVLAQQVVAMASLDTVDVPELLALLQRTAPYAALSRTVLDAVLDMLAGRYPSEEFAELRPRIVWDRLTDTITSRRGAQHLAVTSGGTIPDRGLFGVFLAGDGPGRRVGELDEEMVYESRVGDVFTLGTSSWRIEQITHDQVLVTPAPGEPGKLPFWKGETPGRPAELGRALGAYMRELAAAPAAEATAAALAGGLDPWAADNLVTYLREQQEATGQVPCDRTLVIERFRDEIGDWRVAVHSPFGMPVHAPWALCVSARMQERFGVDVQAMAADDGIVFRLPDVDYDEADTGALLSGLLVLDPDDVEDLVTAQLPGSALFAARFRECAARALLLPRRRPGKRQPLWQQRQRAAQLLQVASNYPDFPIVLEAVRECVQDVYDVPGLVTLMREIAARQVTVVDIRSEQPSPFAKSLLFGYVGQFLYEGDSPLAERRAAALALDPALLAEVLGRGEGLALRDLLDPGAIARTVSDLQRLAPERAARDADEITDLLRVLGPLTAEQVRERVVPEIADQLETLIALLAADRRVILVRIGGIEHAALAEDAARLRDALGVALPLGLPAVFLEPVADPLADLLARFARTRGPFVVADAARHFGIGPAVAADGLRRLVAVGRIVEGEFLPAGAAREFCDAEVLRLLRRRSLAALRAEVDPVATADYARFLPGWQGVGGRQRGPEGVLRVVEQLSGLLLPASAVESLVLPTRVINYAPAMLDEVAAAGDVVWQGHGGLPGGDGWVSVHLRESASLTLHPAGALPEGEVAQAIVTILDQGGAYFAQALAERIPAATAEQLSQALWSLVWAGRVTGDTFAPVRGLLRSGAGGAHKARSRPARGARYGRRGSLGALSRASLGRPAGGAAGGLGAAGSGGLDPVLSPATAGRWSVLPSLDLDPTARALMTAEVLLDRYGVVTRGVADAEDTPGGFHALYRVLAAAEESGRVRRGYFVESLGAAQFATNGAIDRLRTEAAARPVITPEEPATTGSGALAPGRTTATRLGPTPASAEPRASPARTLVLAACDPANPYGGAIPWPSRPEREEDTGHLPGRKAGALVVLVDGELTFYVERGGKTLLSWDRAPGALRAAADALALAVRDGALGRLTVERADGAAVLGSAHPVAAALADAGFRMTPRGLRLRG
ncbi:MAG: DEAD/DEAH box helicase [Tetrasphaera sp.]